MGILLYLQYYSIDNWDIIGMAKTTYLRSLKSEVHGTTTKTSGIKLLIKGFIWV